MENTFFLFGSFYKRFLNRWEGHHQPAHNKLSVKLRKFTILLHKYPTISQSKSKQLIKLIWKKENLCKRKDLKKILGLAEKVVFKTRRILSKLKWNLKIILNPKLKKNNIKVK